MKISEIYHLAIEKGMENDPRGLEEVKKILEKEEEKFRELKEDEKKEYDRDKQFNPYSDSRVLFGDMDKEVNHVLAGIDMEVGEVLLADRMAALGQAVDLIIAHHPEGKAMAALYQVMHLQEDVLARFGVPINVAEGILASRINEVMRGLLPINHNRAVDAARILNLPLMCVHTPADNMVTNYLQKEMDEKKPERLDDVIKLLKEIPEYAEAVKHNAGPTIILGSKEKRAGRIMVDMTGGTGGSKDAYAKLAVAGVGTMITMHISEKNREEAEKNHINVIVAGHIASDSIGLNLFLDELTKRGLRITPCAGLIRVSRV